MAVTLKQTESAPESYPSTVEGEESEPANAEVAWQRIESYIAWRWTEREVVWIVEGPGEWVPPLTPTTIETVEFWSSADEWETANLTPSPLGGYYLPATGPYRFSGTVGVDDSDVPAAALEAFRRLSAYLIATNGSKGTTSRSVTTGSVSIRTTTDEAVAARGLINSGAGDLLRSYRRAG